MQVNPDIQYNQEDAGLSLDNEPIKQSAKQESSEAQDEADLSAVEENQKDVVVKGTQVISSPRGIKFSKRDDRFIVGGSMVAGVFAVIMVYIAVVFI